MKVCGWENHPPELEILHGLPEAAVLCLHWQYYPSMIIHLLRKYNRHLGLMIGILTPSTHIFPCIDMWWYVEHWGDTFPSKKLPVFAQAIPHSTYRPMQVWCLEHVDLNSLDAAAEVKGEVILTSSIDMSVWLFSEPDSYSGRASDSSGLMHAMKAVKLTVREYRSTRSRAIRCYKHLFILSLTPDMGISWDFLSHGGTHSLLSSDPSMDVG